MHPQHLGDLARRCTADLTRSLINTGKIGNETIWMRVVGVKGKEHLDSCEPPNVVSTGMDAKPDSKRRCASPWLSHSCFLAASTHRAMLEELLTHQNATGTDTAPCAVAEWGWALFCWGDFLLCRASGWNAGRGYIGVRQQGPHKSDSARDARHQGPSVSFRRYSVVAARQRAGRHAPRQLKGKIPRVF